AFYTDTDAEIAKVRELVEAEGARVALSRHWEKGGAGAIEFAEAVVDACEEKTEFKFLYMLDMPLKQRIELIAKEVYGADGVDYSPVADRKLTQLQADPDVTKMGVCMVKTHLSLSDNPGLKGAPKDWRLAIREVLVYRGAGFIVPVAGDISLMPGTCSNPAFKRIDVDVETGKVRGIF
ncbi:MAG: formate--tetrahydrofolate ligase, partial [Desulfobacterales bacterium]|nr:formate--tetrahydrofolate ligase [Desulfobacterales bacterium]